MEASTPSYSMSKQLPLDNIYTVEGARLLPQVYRFDFLGSKILGSKRSSKALGTMPCNVKSRAEGQGE